MTAIRSSGRPTAWAKMTGVSASRISAVILNASSSCRGRATDAGLYRTMTKSAPSAARSRCSMSCPRLQIIRQRYRAKIVAQRRTDPRAAASIAVTPGSTWMSRSRHAVGPCSTASKTAAAIANTPGSPPETTTTCRPLAGETERQPGAVEFGPVVESMALLAGFRRHQIEIGAIADQISRRRKRRSGGGGQPLWAARAEADHGQTSRRRHPRCPRPGTRISEK